MHIPDGFLSTPVWAGLAAAAGPGVAWAARRASATLDERRVPLLGVMGAFVFAAQMVNFPVGIGTSGHLVGGALLSMTVGPAPAAVVMTAIVAVQALVFGDGGVLALGANTFNMALAGVAAGYLPYAFLAARWRTAAVFLGGFLSVTVSAALALAELWISGVAMPAAVLGVSAALFLASAAAEGVITVLALRAIDGLNRGWVRPAEPAARRATWAIAAAAVAVVVLGVLVASSLPDGLESFAQQVGVAARERTTLAAPLAEYEAPWASGEWARQASAGLVGLALVFAATAGAARMMSRRRSQAD